jgi:hypothetical protein
VTTEKYFSFKTKQTKFHTIFYFIILAEVVTVLNHEKHKLRKKDINNLKSESVHFYKVPGTQRYLMIDDTGLDAKHISDDTSDDASKLINNIYA